MFSILLAVAMTAFTHPVEREPAFSIGVIADCQFADRDPSGVRQYRASPDKLAEAVDAFNTLNLAFVVSLGDFIDRDWDSYATLEPIAARLEAPWRHVLGNHDFDVADTHKHAAPAALGMPARYYAFERENWIFIVLDGNDVSLHAWPQDSPENVQSRRLHETRYRDRASYNGALSDAQMEWLDEVLSQADKAGRRAVLMSHFPVFPENRHNLWNDNAVLDLIDQHPSVSLWLNGHNHEGNYGERTGVHFVTFRGMVDTVETAYAVLEFHDDRVEIRGQGREPDRTLPLRRSGTPEAQHIHTSDIEPG